MPINQLFQQTKLQYFKEQNLNQLKIVDLRRNTNETFLIFFLITALLL